MGKVASFVVAAGAVGILTVGALILALGHRSTGRDRISTGAPSHRLAGTFHNQARLDWPKEINPVVKRIYPEMEAGEYADALRDIDADEAFLERHGARPLGAAQWSDQKLECLFELGQYRQVATMWDRHPSGGDAALGAVAISLIKEGRYAEATQFAVRYVPDKAILRWVSPPDVTDYAQIEPYIPRVGTESELECRLRLYRGVALAALGCPAQGMRELQVAHAMMPCQPLVAKELGDAYFSNRMPEKAKALAPVLEGAAAPSAGAVPAIFRHEAETFRLGFQPGSPPPGMDEIPRPGGPRHMPLPPVRGSNAR